MSKAKAKQSAAASAAMTKDLQKKVEDLTASLELLKNENETLKTKFKILCKKIVDNTDMSDYSFIDANIEPDKIELNDLLHMVQKLGLLASQITSEDNIENHVEALELRITELTSENSTFFKNKLKLQERLEFIMQERDVWRRNAETLKKMYAKLVKEKEYKPQFKTDPSANKCTIGTYRENIDAKNPSKRTYSAPVPKEFFDNIRNTNITSIQLEKIEQSVSSQLAQIQIQPLTPRSSENDFHNEKNFFLNDKNPISFTNTVTSTEFVSFPNLESKKPEQLSSSSTITTSSSNTDLQSDKMSDHFVSNDIELIEKPVLNTSNNNMNSNNLNQHKKIVSFNNDIDVRIYRKNSKHSAKIVDSYLLPLAQRPSPGQQSQNTQQTAQQQQLNQNLNQSPQEITIQQHQENQQKQMDKINSIEENINLIKKSFETNGDTGNFLGKNRLLRQNSASDIKSLYSMVQRQPTSSSGNLGSLNLTSSSDYRFANRASVSSSKKFPGETPVKDLEPTLKLIIIKELSVEKLDGKDWRMFALRVGINENEIKEWVSLKLQYPMARVLSFWSSKPEATIRILHRHLSAPCFNYGPLAKRIENFYDVI